jgi:hypothetical protein
MSIPVTICAGYMSIYSSGSISGLQRPDNRYQFGIVDKLSGSEGPFLIGQSVLFPVASTIQIIYNNTTYYIAKEVDIVLIEEPAP